MLNDEDDEISFAIHTFDVKESIDILTNIDFRNVDSEDLIEKVSEIDEQYPSTAVMPEGDVFICKECYVFTTKHNCNFCGRETSDIEL